MSSAPSRTLDSNPVTTEVTNPEPNDRTCQRRLVFTNTQPNDSHAGPVQSVTDPCGKPATHVMFRTCCGGPPAFTCEEHSNPFLGDRSTVCMNCHHRCIKGVCCHRVVTTL